MSKTITRLYNSHAEARAAVRQLEAAGVSQRSIASLVSNADNAYDEKTKSFPDRDLDGKDDRAEGAAAGGGVGAAVGGTAGLLAGLGLLAIPGVRFRGGRRLACRGFDGSGRRRRDRRRDWCAVPAGRHQR